MTRFASIPLLLVTALLVAGCQAIQPAPPAHPAHPERMIAVSNQPQSVTPWLQILQRQLQLNPEQAQQALDNHPSSKQEPQRFTQELQQFEQLLLRQQLQQRGGWIVARDRLRELLSKHENDTITPLLQLLLQYNQAMINADQRQQKYSAELDQMKQQYSDLEQQLLQSQQHSLELEAKIQALTNLEQRLNTRKSAPSRSTP